MSILTERNPFYVSGKPLRPSKVKSTEFFRLFADHCDKVDPTFVKEWDREFNMVARVNPVKLSESAFPFTTDEMQDLFKSVAMGVEVKEAQLKPTMMACLKELEPLFKALPGKVFHPQALKQELGSAVDTPELKKALRLEEHSTRHRLLCCMVVTSGIAFFLKLFSASRQPSAMEAAAASLLESLSPFIGHLTSDALLKFFKAKVALRTSVFKTPLDQLARDMIRSDLFSVKLFCPEVVEKVTVAFGKFRDRTVSWSTLLARKPAGPSGQREQAPSRPRVAGGRSSFRRRDSRPFRGSPYGGRYQEEAPRPYGQPFRGRRVRGTTIRGTTRGGRRGRSAPPPPRQ